MKKLYLYQALMTPMGFIGKLLVEGEEFFTMENHRCLEEGEHKLQYTIDGFRVDDTYRVCMDTNGKYRNAGLVIGLDISPHMFDVHRKGDALTRLYQLVGDEECILEVRNASAKLVADKLVEITEEDSGLKLTPKPERSQEKRDNMKQHTDNLAKAIEIQNAPVKTPSVLSGLGAAKGDDDGGKHSN